MLGCVFFAILHARPPVQRAPGIPCALCFLRAKLFAKPRAHRAAGMRSRICRHCEEQRDEAIRSCFAAAWIASRSLSLGARSRDRLARNDDLKTALAD